jgi:hypothetical protein
LVLLQLAAHVAGHGLLLQPRSRNWLAYLNSNNYWSHGLNAGGESCHPCFCITSEHLQHINIAATDRLQQQLLQLLSSDHLACTCTANLTTFPSLCCPMLAGVNVVSNKGKLKWPHGRHGLCGDAYNEQKWDVPGEVQQTYMAGQVSD